MEIQNKSSVELFEENWKAYQIALDKNYLYHQEMYSKLKEYLSVHYTNQSLKFLDLGCGNASYITDTLKDFSLEQYIGVDIAAPVLPLAKKNLNTLNGSIQLVEADFFEEIDSIPGTFDIVLISYALHHLPTLQQKQNFIQKCQTKLKTNGCLIVIDIFSRPNQTQADWFSEYEAYFHKHCTSLNDIQTKLSLDHIRDYDFPETIDNYKQIAQTSGFQQFEVLNTEGDFWAMLSMHR